MTGKGTCMHARAELEAAIQAQIHEFTSCADFIALCDGSFTRESYDAFIARVVQTHLRSPKYLAFLFALVPPGRTADSLQHNLLEELGIEEEDGVSHPELLNGLLDEAGISASLPQLLEEADNDLKRYTSDPLLYGTLKEIGFSVLSETVAFEYMLSRCATRIASALHLHRGISEKGLVWFTHHSEVDIAHAEQGLDNAQYYADWYGMTERDTRAIIEMSFRENVFVKRYFGTFSFAKVRGIA